MKDNGWTRQSTKWPPNSYLLVFNAHPAEGKHPEDDQKKAAGWVRRAIEGQQWEEGGGLLLLAA